jgi:hypothetical protein
LLNRSWKRTASIFNVVAALVSGWIAFYPQPHDLAVPAGIVMPWLALLIVSRSGGRVRVYKKRYENDPNVAIGFIFPGAILLFRDVSDFNLLNWKMAWAAAVVIGFVLAFLAARSDPSIRRSVALLVPVEMFCLLYGLGAGVAANALFDHASASKYEVRIRSQWISNGRSASAHLELEPWGPRAAADRVIVNPRLFANKKAGDLVCVELKPGSLGIPWYVVNPCANR